MNQFIVTTIAGNQTQCTLWDPKLPLGLGHPLRWIAELTQQGLRIRALNTPDGQTISQGVTEISHDQLLPGSPGTEIALPLSSGMRLQIRSVNSLVPAFHSKQGSLLSIFVCNKNWILSSSTLSPHHCARVDDAKIFSIQSECEKHTLTVHAPKLSMQTANQPEQTLTENQTLTLTTDQLTHTRLFSSTRSWRFGLSQTTQLPTQIQQSPDAETLWFHKSLKASALAFGVLACFSWFWPKPQNDLQELIPAQYAKIVLSKPATPPQAKAMASQGNPLQGQTAIPEKVQKAAVIQAFRAKALSNAVKGLLKGGMTQLLAQSDFVAGKTTSAEARRTFDTKSIALQSNGPMGTVNEHSSRSIASIGGSGEGKGSGYGKGEHAGIKGQGQAFVSMDIAGAAVDEGLTKDEVGEVIHRHLSEVRYCYESAMIRTPDLEGKLMVNFTIAGAGAVRSTEVKNSTLPDPRLDDCILRRLVTWKFPNPRGGIEVAVTYPFIFKTLGR
ncbi:AgmX/PglI C-terminal domain-containing protein [Bdellovibrionota bacterium FG-1]